MQVVPLVADTAEGSLKTSPAPQIQRSILRSESAETVMGVKRPRSKKAVCFIDRTLGCPIATVHLVDYSEGDQQPSYQNRKNSCCSVF